ncbi:hypothetical protein F2P81_016511 [Scophthalmus maximus]|uniref:Uncharacterized protein n=1 Tax=Scophthalmus maximus TaxID=52904 RepID=A0A6A4S9T5_SCOMX|nr:hypothetical protein F2P81_016511 [Scophthalmus maximus]
MTNSLSVEFRQTRVEVELHGALNLKNLQDFMALNQATPPGYTYIQKPCSMGHGGGLAVIHQADIPVKELPVPNVTSFECLRFSLDWAYKASPCLPPPKSFHYIHVQEFLSLLDCLNIIQHVNGPTHTKGYKLDLVCSTGTTPSHLQCIDLAVSNHSAIIFSAQASTKCTITFRNIKSVSTSSLAKTVAPHLAPVPPDSTVDGLAANYNAALSLSLDTLAPLKTLTVSFSRPAPWFTTELRSLKATDHQLEQFVKDLALLSTLRTSKTM